MVELSRAVRAKGGWTEEETKTLFEEARIAGSEGRSVKSVFDKMSEMTGRKPNSIRNYYYLKLRENGEHTSTAFVPFGQDEVDALLKRMLTGQAMGKSVRGIALELAGGDKKAMLRYQNKYRSLLKSDPDLIRHTMHELTEQGCECADPFAVAKKPQRDISLLLSELIDNLTRSGADCQELLCSLNSLASAAARGGDERLSGELGRTMEENSQLRRKLDRLKALNRGFVEMSGIERITGLAEYIDALSSAIYEQ